MNTIETLQQDLLSLGAKIGNKARISFGDVKRLSRDCLADGIRTRAEAEFLLALDARAKKADPAWTPWLVASIVDFVVWGERPTGTVDEATARWLGALLIGADGLPSSRTAKLILREIAAEAQAFENDALAAFQVPAPAAPQIPLAA